MCGISIAKKDKLISILRNQQDRGLDSMGVITGDNVYSLAGNYFQYKKVIKKYVRKDSYNGLCIMHTRKASVGVVSEANSHPFETKSFLLVQNGTSRALFNRNSFRYKFETDSEVLANMIEDNCVSLGDIPEYIDSLSKEINDKLGVIIIKGRTTGNILFWTDGDRETYIDASEGFVHEITNYKNKNGFENKGYILMKSDGEVIATNMEGVNSKVFMPKYTYYLPESKKKKKKNYAKTPPTNALENEMEFYPKAHGYDDDWYNEQLEKEKCEEQLGITINSIEYTESRMLLTKEERQECDVAVEFFFDNAHRDIDMGMGYEFCLNYYLEYYYHTKNKSIFFMTFKYHFPEKGFKLAYSYIYGI